MSKTIASILIVQPGSQATRIAKTCRKLGIRSVVARYVEEDEDDSEDGKTVFVTPGNLSEVVSELQVDAVHVGYGATLSRDLYEAVQGLEVLILGDLSGSERAQDLDQFQRLCEELQVCAKPGKRISSEQEARGILQDLPLPWLVTSWRCEGWHDHTFIESEEELTPRLNEALERTNMRTGTRDLFVSQWHSGTRILAVPTVTFLKQEKEPEATPEPEADSDENQAASRPKINKSKEPETKFLALMERDETLSFRDKLALVETPSPILLQSSDEEEIRDTLFEAAISLVRDMQCCGVATMYFALEADKRMYALPPKFGLSYADAATELESGVDLVEQQFAIAHGTVPADEIFARRRSGHAFSVLLTADERSKNIKLRTPPAAQGRVRIEEGDVSEGSQASLLQITTYAPRRLRSLLLMDRTLTGTIVDGAQSNRNALIEKLRDESFRSGLAYA